MDYAHRWGSPNRVVKVTPKGLEKSPRNSLSQPAKHTAKASKAFERLNGFVVKRRVVVVRPTRQLSSQWQWKSLYYKFLHPVGMKMHFNCATDTKLCRCAWKRFSHWGKLSIAAQFGNFALVAGMTAVKKRILIRQRASRCQKSVHLRKKRKIRNKLNECREATFHQSSNRHKVSLVFDLSQGSSLLWFHF